MKVRSVHNSLKFQQNFHIISLLVFFIPFLLYLKTAAPTISPGDSDLVSAAYTLGLPHPPSFPLYVLLGRIFTFLPVGEIAFRVSLLSVLCGGLISVFVYLTLQTVNSSVLLPVFGALFFAFTPGVWAQLNRSEVYSLYLVVLAIIFYLWLGRKREGFDYLLAFLLALGFTAHPGLAMSHFLIILFLLLAKKIRHLPVIFCLLMMFFMFFFLPLRGIQEPLINWGKPTRIDKFLPVILTKSYQHFLEPGWLDVVRKTPEYFTAILEQYAYFGVFLVGFGAYLAFKRSGELNRLIIAVVLSNPPLLLMKSDMKPNALDYFGYLAPMVLALFFWGVGGLDELVKRLKLKSQFMLVIFALLIILWGGTSFQRSDQADNFLNYDYAENMLNTVDSSPAQLSLKGDNEMLGIIYLLAQGKRPDIVIGYTEITGAIRHLPGAPRYYSYSYFSQSPPDKFLNGLMFQDHSPTFRPVRYYRTRGFKLEKARDVFSRWILITYYSALAENFQSRQKTTSVNELRQKIEQIAGDMAPVLYELGTRYLSSKDLEKARTLFQRVIKTDPAYYKAHNDLGLLLREEREFLSSVKHFQKALALAPRFHQARFNLAVTWDMAGDRVNALAGWQEYLKYAQGEPLEAPYVKKAKARLQSLEK